MKYLTSSAISNKWKLSERSVRNYASSGRIIGCYLKGKTWMIPENASRPARKKRVSTKQKNLLETLEKEMKSKVSGGIFTLLQIEFNYNSNHMEGSKLTHEQTQYIFETNTIIQTEGPTSVDDVIETINHFNCFRYVINNARKQLTESTIKQLHYLLKVNTSQYFNGYSVGDYKVMENEVGGCETVSPIKVKEEMRKLLAWYNALDTIEIKDIIEFHYRFERIHPFQDGNGRVGRLIMLKECLKHNIVPILIKDTHKDFYYRGLREYKTEKGYLVDTCLFGQDVVKTYLDYFKIKY